MKIPLNTILEELFGVSKITSKEQLDELVKKLRQLPPDTVIINTDKLESAQNSVE